MALSTWWQGDPVPEIRPVDGFHAATSQNIEELERLTGLSPDEIEDRLNAGHRVYVAYIDDNPAAYGWVATLGASIGELNIRFDLSSGDRYLWDFVTLPEWRGRGIYPQLLQAMLRSEGPDASRFWIIHAPENAASGSGIRKAGFEPVSDLSFQRDLRPGVVPHQSNERARIGASVLGVDLLEALESGRVVSPCWRCVIAANSGETDDAPCWSKGAHNHHCDCVMGPATVTSTAHPAGHTPAP